jgi:uncharacterized protein YciI
MLFVIIATDHEGAFDKRLATRDTHVAWLKGLGDAVKLAGPFIVPEEDISNGSLIIIEADDEQGARDLAAADPYAKAGLFKHVEIRPWNWTINAPKDL